MTKRNPVTSVQNNWFNAQQVDDVNLKLEQNYNNTITSGIINNHIGTGVLAESLEDKVLFDSMLVSGFLDGKEIHVQNQPSDNSNGNQLEIVLKDSSATVRRNIKVAIIGLDFQSNLQYETFYFKKNESQITEKHFSKVLLLLFNDFIGNDKLSLNLGGHITIKEASPYSLSRAPKSISQDVEPNLFFRDFFVDGLYTLDTLLKNSLPTYDVSSLGIKTEPKDNKILLANDVVTQIGQKFKSKTNNLQKITLLLSVRNLDPGSETDLVWNGDLVLSVYPLQSNLSCPTDFSPDLPIDFSPSNIPLGQISINYTTLQSQGIILDETPQPVDFIFSNSSIASGNVISSDKYYAFTLKRSGSANKCDVLLANGSDLIADSRVTIFTGDLWVDIPEEDLWFQIWSDSAKISDGQAYDNGIGIILPKVENGSDNILKDISFVGNDVFKAQLLAKLNNFEPIPDERTGEPVNSKKEYIPQIKLLNSIDVANIEQTSDTLLLGAISDKNRKFYDSISSQIASKLYSSTIVKDEIFIKVVDDPTDSVRFDTLVTGLSTNLLNGDLVFARIVPNSGSPNLFYRLTSARLCSMTLGDVNGDGIIDSSDLDLLNSYLNFNMNISPPLDTLITTDGYSTVVTNGYTTLTNKFENAFGLEFQLIDPATGLVLDTGTDGTLVQDPNDDRLARFTSSSVTFNNIIGLASYQLVILTDTIPGNNGTFEIVSIDNVTDVITLRKIFLNEETMDQILRSDINGDFFIDYVDGYLLQSYINREVLTFSPTSTYPAPSTNPYTKIGTRFSVIKLKVEPFIDRADDYQNNLSLDRLDNIHTLPDIVLNDGYLSSHNYYTSPISILISKQLSWDESLVVTNSKPKLIPCVFTEQNEPINKCLDEDILCNIYPTKLEHDPGAVNYFSPDNLIIGKGELKRKDGSFYKVDFEVGTIVLEIPDGLFGSEKTLNVLDDFVADYNGKGNTRLGFPSMKFADCSYVTSDALIKDQLRFSVAVQSFSPNVNGLSEDGYSGAIVDGKIGIAIDYSTGLLTLNFSNLYQDEVLSTLSTKIQINVFLKKGGFNNSTLFVDSTKVQNMLKLTSVFSGANEGGPSALVDLESDVSGVLPVIHGGTGMNAVGASGTVLVSNGTSLSYQFISSLLGIQFSSGLEDASQMPITDGYGLLDPSFMYKNPVYIYGVAGAFSNNKSSPTTIGALTFRFDNYILQGLKQIKLEAILETTNAGNTASLKLFDLTNHSYITLDGISPSLIATSTTATYVVSDDIKSSLNEGEADFIYEVQIQLDSTSATDEAICKMARLVMTYDNPVNPSPPLARSYNFVPFLASPVSS